MLKPLIFAAAAAGLMAVPAQADEAEPTRGEAKLAKLLDGRVAGEPQNCISVCVQTHASAIPQIHENIEACKRIGVYQQRHEYGSPDGT